MGGSFVISILHKPRKRSINASWNHNSAHTNLMQTKPTKHVGTQTWKKNTTSSIFSYSIFCEQQRRLRYSGERCCTILEKES